MDAAQYYNYTEQDEFVNILVRYLKKNHPNDPAIKDLEALRTRNDLQFDMLQEHFKANVKLQKILEKHKVVSKHATEDHLHSSKYSDDD